jgi:hypothetical protein
MAVCRTAPRLNMFRSQLARFDLAQLKGLSGLALLELNCLRPVSDRQPDCSENVPTSTKNALDFAVERVHAPRVVSKPFRDRDNEVSVLGTSAARDDG